MTRRRNGEASIFRYRNGFAAYAWVTTPDGLRKRKWVYGKTHDEVHAKWLKLQAQAKEGPVATSTPKLEPYLRGWLRDIVKPNLAPKTYETREMIARLYIIPFLGGKRIDKLTARDVRQWLNQLRDACQCCIQGKDARRPRGKQRCCAVGRCCHQAISGRTLRDARDVLRAALGHAVSEDELITRNVARLVRLPAPRTRKAKAWSVAEACQFLESARTDDDPLYAAYVLMLILGLRRGEALGLPWHLVNLDRAEIDVSWQLQRAGGQLHHRETKTPGSDAPLPLPAVCLAALKLQAERQAAWKRDAAEAWHDSGLVVTTSYGSPYEPRNFNRHFAARCRAANVRSISPHGMRRTCGSLLAALDIHPRVAMRILRHSKITITMEVYTEVPDDLTRDALRRLGEQFGD